MVSGAPREQGLLMSKQIGLTKALKAAGCLRLDPRSDCRCLHCCIVASYAQAGILACAQPSAVHLRADTISLEHLRWACDCAILLARFFQRFKILWAFNCAF